MHAAVQGLAGPSWIWMLAQAGCSQFRAEFGQRDGRHTDRFQCRERVWACMYVRKRRNKTKGRPHDLKPKDWRKDRDRENCVIWQQVLEDRPERQGPGTPEEIHHPVMTSRSIQLEIATLKGTATPVWSIFALFFSESETLQSEEFEILFLGE